MDKIAEIAGKLTEAQREWLFALEPNTECQRLPVRFYEAGAGVEMKPAEYEEGILVCPAEIAWLGSSSWRLSNGFITSRLNETGLAVRNYLNGE